jgi:sugar/nucleoside kinase (ribokinase family)
MQDLLQRTIEQLESKRESTLPLKAFVGFDGFVDKIQRPVRRRDNGQAKYFDTISDYAQRMAEAAGKSAQIELALQAIKLGGNAPIMANALAALGFDATCMGALGAPVVHPVFQPLAERCEVISLGPPAETNALEFHDGKIMLSDFSAFRRMDWAHIKETYGLEAMVARLEVSRLVALVDWSNVIHATDIWEGIHREALPLLFSTDRHFFFDLCDPSAKPLEEINRMLDVVSGFAGFGTTTLGLNENETIKLYHMLHPDQPQTDLRTMAWALFHRLDIHYLMVHPVDRTMVFSGESVTEMPTRLVPDPKLLTGAGDNLNAGYCLGLLLGLPLRETLAVATAAAGAYISNGHSPTQQELLDYLRLWLGEG